MFCGDHLYVKQVIRANEMRGIDIWLDLLHILAVLLELIYKSHAAARKNIHAKFRWVCGLGSRRGYLLSCRFETSMSDCSPMKMLMGIARYNRWLKGLCLGENV